MSNVATTIEIFNSLSYPLDNSHVRYFSSISEQSTFFDNLTKAKTLTSQKYQRVGDFEFTTNIRGDVFNAQKWGYARYKNPSESDKWYYCFINKVRYIDNLSVELSLSIDFYQTYFFDMNIKQSMVERQHEKLWETSGLPIVNTTDEGLNYGNEYDIVYNEPLKPSPIYLVHIVSTKEIFSSTVGSLVGQVGTPTPLYHYCIPYLVSDNKSIEIKQLDDTTAYTPDLHFLFKKLASDEGIVNSIVSVYSSLYCGIDFSSAYNSSTNILDVNLIGNGSDDISIISSTMDFGTGVEECLLQILYAHSFQTKLIGSYNKYENVPSYIESKLLMYPYTVVEINDYKGNTIQLKPEYIKGAHAEIRVKGGVSSENKVGYYVSNYLPNINSENDISSYHHSLIDNSPNNIPIVTDATADYVQGNINQINTQRANSKRDVRVDTGTSIANAIPSLFIGPVLGAQGVIGGATNIIDSKNRDYKLQKSLDAKMQDINNVPPSASAMGGNTSYEWGNNLMYPRLLIKTIKPEYREKLENFFKLYGYQVNKLTYPNLKTRKNWNYVKVTDLSVTSGMNREIVMRFKEIFEKGVTLWHNDDIMNYNKTNEVI